MDWLTCCLRDVAEPCSASEAALSWVPLSSFARGSSALAVAEVRSSRAASTISRCLHLSSSSSSTPASVAVRRSPMRTRSLPDQSEFTHPRRPAILVGGAGRRNGCAPLITAELPRSDCEEWAGQGACPGRATQDRTSDSNIAVACAKATLIKI